jgi:hypothetical protein
VRGGGVALADRGEHLELDCGLESFGSLVRVDGLEKQLGRWLLGCRSRHVKDLSLDIESVKRF